MNKFEGSLIGLICGISALALFLFRNGIPSTSYEMFGFISMIGCICSLAYCVVQ